LLETLKTQYDFIIIDAPGVIEEDYAVNLAAIADYCLFVIDSKMTKKAYVDESLRALSDIAATPTGIILNKVDSIFIEDSRIKLEAKRTRSSIWQRIQAFLSKWVGIG
jgi:Mrp family chromosome partitioning ATPase